MRVGTIAALIAAVALTACGGKSGGVQTPEQLRGVWAADCTSPFVRIEAGKVHVYPDKATYDLKAATLAGESFSVTYDRPEGEMTDVYVVAGDTLRLASTRSSAGEAVWNKQPMSKCG